ncbi:unnamed protein product [Prorocentrum cordatum]|uniref:Uncharacterized protein n=1 Tax=Prorocentrum cordatum TaxID=2364126 RepID=A0ABN9UQ96_9DINO|nr:unnamed protein product [Polarella glacialis]
MPLSPSGGCSLSLGLGRGFMRPKPVVAASGSHAAHSPASLSVCSSPFILLAPGFLVSLWFVVGPGGLRMECHVGCPRVVSFNFFGFLIFAQQKKPLDGHSVLPRIRVPGGRWRIWALTVACTWFRR